ncbi:MAG TPA: class I SAM-dependent methyltransferase [Vicinamibacteria bacterium]|nr:class I SAM-dependent methyltransferase [Vicinamibacteria bacterium]
MKSPEQQLLEEINRELPRDVDWKAGARRYVRELVARGGPSFRQWHLTKPFLGEPLAGAPLHGDGSRPAVDPHVTFHELFAFLDVLLAVDLPPGARVLDVGCGPGWTSHYLGKMGYTVLGLDLSEEMLELARTRVEAEPFPPHPRRRLDVSFVGHDIEAAPLGGEAGEPYHFALVDSALHHFLNPVAALRHLGESLRPDALVAIVEAFRPEGAPLDAQGVAIMERYQTLERPYTRSQMSDILRLSGFEHYVFLHGVNGLALDPELPLAPGPTRAVLAARETRALGRWGGLVWSGFHDEERDARGPYRWARPTSGLVLDGRDLVLTFTTIAPRLGRPKHDVFVSVDDALVTVLHLRESEPEVRFRPGPLPRGSRLGLHSDFSFRPKLMGMNDDDRVLAFQLRVSEA